MLGIHSVGAHDVVVRVLLPNALRVRLLEPAVELARVPGTALFEWQGPRGDIAAPYRIRWESHDGRWHEGYDPYSFPLEIDDERSRTLREPAVTSTRIASSARTSATIAGVRGIRFAVWAPNAERVSVVGTFNHWDGRYHPMSVRGNSGVWELFLPELGAGELYKYELYTRDSRELKLKTDPYGAAFEKRPATAAITTPPSTFRWDDAAWLEAARAARLARGADLDLRGASRLVAPQRGRQFLSYRELAGQLAAYVKDLGLHARRAAADHGAPVRRLVGLPVHGLLRADEPARLARRAARARRRAAPARDRRAARLGSGAFSEGRSRARALRRHGALRIRRSAEGRASRLEHARVQLHAQRGPELPAVERDLLARGLPLRRPARRRRRVDALSRLLARAAPVDAESSTAATRTSRRSRS